MLFSDGQDGREKPPDATKKHKSDQSTAFDLLLGPNDNSDRDLTAGELEPYFAERAISHQTKPLHNAKCFPRLATVAPSLLYIPTTSTPYSQRQV